MTALIIGSITPDFEYFIRMKILAIHSHSLAGVFYFDLPLGIILTFLFHGVIRDTLIDNLPLPLKQRAVAVRYFNWAFYFRHHFVTVLASLLIGIFSHLLWDGFTHERGEFVEMIPQLRTLHNVFGVHVYLYRILQHSSTIIGLIVIGFVFWRLPMHKYVSPHIDIRYWVIITVITIGITAVRTSFHSEDFKYTQPIVTIIAGGIIGLSVAPWLLKVMKERTVAR